MKTHRLWLFPLALACLALVGISDAHAGKKKAKTEAMTLKIANLTKETPKAEVKKLEKEVKKVKGVKKVKVPPGTQPQTRIRLPGHGLIGKGGHRGHLYLVVVPRVPRTLTAAQKELVEKLTEEGL